MVGKIDVVTAKEHDGREAGAGDGVAFRDGLHGVAHGVEVVGDRAHFFRQAAHHGDAAGVVGDRAKGIERDDDAGHREHRHHRDRNAVKPGRAVAEPDARRDAAHGQRRGVHAHAEAGDDVRGVAGLARFGDLAHGRVFGGGVVVRDEHRRARHQQADDRGKIDAARRVGRAAHAEHVLRFQPFGEHRHGHRIEDRRADRRAEQHATHERGARLRIGHVHENDARDRGEDGQPAEDERIDHRSAEARGQRPDEHRTDQGHRVGFKNIRRHAGAVAHVVAHVVRDGRGVAGIVFIEVRLHLAHEVRAHVCRFRINAAAEPREN